MQRYLGRALPGGFASGRQFAPCLVSAGGTRTGASPMPRRITPCSGWKVLSGADERINCTTFRQTLARHSRCRCGRTGEVRAHRRRCGWVAGQAEIGRRDEVHAIELGEIGHEHADAQQSSNAAPNSASRAAPARPIVAAFSAHCTLFCPEPLSPSAQPVPPVQLVPVHALVYDCLKHAVLSRSPIRPGLRRGS